MFENPCAPAITLADMAEPPNGPVLACCYPGCGTIHAWGQKTVDPATYLLVAPPPIGGISLRLTTRGQPLNPTICAHHAAERFPSTGARLALARSAGPVGALWAYQASAEAGPDEFVLAWIASTAFVEVAVPPEASPTSFVGLVLLKLLKGGTNAPSHPCA